MVANKRPPITARPSGAFCSPPSPIPSAIGSMPMIICTGPPWAGAAAWACSPLFANGAEDGTGLLNAELAKLFIIEELFERGSLERVLAVETVAIAIAAPHDLRLGRGLDRHDGRQNNVGRVAKCLGEFMGMVGCLGLVRGVRRRTGRARRTLGRRVLPKPTTEHKAENGHDCTEIGRAHV
mgnify:CR=1 FL=1